MLVAGFLFGCMGVFVKLGEQYFSSVELVFYRSFVGLLVVYVILRQQRVAVSTKHWQGHLWRGLCGSLALMLFFYCITVLPLATAVTLNYTSPLFLALLTTLVLKERLHLTLALTITLGFIGIVLLLQPTLEHNQLIPGLLGLISGFFAGFAMMNVRQLGLRGEPDSRVVFYFSLIAAVISGVAMLLDTIHPVTFHNILILIGLGSSATLAQLAMTRAYRTGKTLVAGSLAYSTVVFASLFGMIIWGEKLPAVGWLGMILIIASGVLSLKLSAKH